MVENLAKTEDEEITASTTLSYADTTEYFIMLNIPFYSVTCSTILSRGSALTYPTSIGSDTSLACGSGYTISLPASTICSSFKAYVSE